MRNINDPAFEVLARTASAGRTPDDAAFDAVLSAMYLLLVDTAVNFYKSQAQNGTLAGRRWFLGSGQALWLSEPWAIAMCEVCHVSHEAFVRYARERWDRELTNPRSRVYKLDHDQIDVWAK